MISPRFLVISRGPAGRLHLDIVLALNEALAEDRVRQMRRSTKVGAAGRGWDPIAISLTDVRSIASALEWKPDKDIERKFNSLCSPPTTS